MRFSDTTKRQARMRQRGRCAVCGDNVDWQEEFAHHIHPDALGGPDQVDNCVIVCRPCHERVHYDGRFRTGIVAPRSYFRYKTGYYR